MARTDETSAVKRLSKWVWLVPSAVLAIAILPLPYAYYVALRWVVAGAALLLAWVEYEPNSDKHKTYVWLFAGFAILYNPILPVHLFKFAWVVINLFTAAAFLGHFKLRARG